MTGAELTKRWENVASKLLLNRKIVGVRYMTAAEADDHGWYTRCVVIKLDNGVLIYPSADDEGNAAGALFTTDPDEQTLPVL
jgi:hypothetical protein